MPRFDRQPLLPLRRCEQLNDPPLPLPRQKHYGGQASPLLHWVEEREKAVLFLTKSLNILPQSLSDDWERVWYK